MAMKNDVIKGGSKGGFKVGCGLGNTLRVSHDELLFLLKSNSAGLIERHPFYTQIFRRPLQMEVYLSIFLALA